MTRLKTGFGLKTSSSARERGLSHGGWPLLVASIVCFLSLTLPTFALDTDGDGWSDELETAMGTNPFGQDIDSDMDGVPDLLEQHLGTNPHDADSDDDGEPDGADDHDNDGLSTLDELRLGLNPRNRDTDGDGERDGNEDADNDGRSNEQELDLDRTNPLNPDTDGDGRNDGEELRLQTNPNNPDTDGDGIPDGQDPLNTPPGARDVLIVKRAGWECVANIWRFREWHSYERRWYDPQTGVIIQRQVLPDLLVRDENSGVPCNDPQPPTPPVPGNLTSVPWDDFNTNASGLLAVANEEDFELDNFPIRATSVHTNGMVGGERDMILLLRDASEPGYGAFASVNNGVLSYTQEASTNCQLLMVYDGKDNDADTVQATLGLGAMDITNGGTQDGVEIDFLRNDRPLRLSLLLFTDRYNSSEITRTIPSLSSPTTITFPFAGLSHTGHGANLSQIEAIVFYFGAFDGVIGPANFVLDEIRSSPAAVLAELMRSDMQFEPGEREKTLWIPLSGPGTVLLESDATLVAEAYDREGLLIDQAESNGRETLAQLRADTPTDCFVMRLSRSDDLIDLPQTVEVAIKFDDAYTTFRDDTLYRSDTIYSPFKTFPGGADIFELPAGSPYSFFDAFVEAEYDYSLEEGILGLQWLVQEELINVLYPPAGHAGALPPTDSNHDDNYCGISTFIHSMETTFPGALKANVTTTATSWDEVGDNLDHSCWFGTRGGKMVTNINKNYGGTSPATQNRKGYCAKELRDTSPANLAAWGEDCNVKVLIYDVTSFFGHWADVVTVTPDPNDASKATLNLQDYEDNYDVTFTDIAAGDQIDFSGAPLDNVMRENFDQGDAVAGDDTVSVVLNPRPIPGVDKPQKIPTEEVWFYVVCECDPNTNNGMPTSTKTGKQLNP